VSDTGPMGLLLCIYSQVKNLWTLALVILNFPLEGLDNKSVKINVFLI